MRRRVLGAALSLAKRGSQHGHDSQQGFAALFYY